MLLQSGCREGQELCSLWRDLRQEKQEAAIWQGVEVQATLGQKVEGVRGCSMDGSTRGRVVEERDITRGALNTRGLQAYSCQDRANIPVWAWLQRDKLSGAWLQALPGHDSSLTSAEFK